MAKTVPSLLRLSQELQTKINGNSDSLCAHITNDIYNVCVNSYSNKETSVDTTRNSFPHCNSRHFKEMTEITLVILVILRDDNKESDVYLPYLQNWQKFEDMATKVENTEMNTK